MTLAIQAAQDNSFRFEPLTAVSYSRVSTEQQVGRGDTDDGFSLTAQRAANKRHALSLGAVVVAEFVERGASARTADRPELQRMLEYVAARRVDLVVVHKLDRLARNRSDDVQIVDALRAAGVRLVSTTGSAQQQQQAKVRACLRQHARRVEDTDAMLAACVQINVVIAHGDGANGL